jgi:hypothetical protein
VEVVPTPEENIVLLPYFLKRGILNGFRPCNLAACRFAQKGGYLQYAGQVRVRPVPAMAENKTGFAVGEKPAFFRRKIGRTAAGAVEG